MKTHSRSTGPGRLAILLAAAVLSAAHAVADTASPDMPADVQTAPVFDAEELPVATGDEATPADPVADGAEEAVAAAASAAVRASRLTVREDEGKPWLSDTRPSGELAWQTGLAMLVVLGLGGGGILVVRRLLPRAGRSSGRSVRVVETTWLAPRKALHIVQVGQRRYLLANTREQISFLADVTGSFQDALESAFADEGTPPDANL